MTADEFDQRTRGVRFKAGTAYAVDHNDRTVYAVVTWLHGERWFAQHLAPGDPRWREEYDAALDPSRAASTIHFPRASR